MTRSLGGRSQWQLDFVQTCGIIKEERKAVKRKEMIQLLDDGESRLVVWLLRYAALVKKLHLVRVSLEARSKRFLVLKWSIALTRNDLTQILVQLESFLM
jgi:hypothetical protein